jgi:hypothetical protein
VPFAEFEQDAAAGTLPDFSLIEPNMMAGHGDYHPAMGRSFAEQVNVEVDNPSSTLSGEAFLARIFNAYRAATSETGTNVWNTALLIGWDEPGGTYDHVPPGPVLPPDASAPSGECGFAFDRSGYRVPAVIVSPWVESGSVDNEEYRHTSLIATLRKRWGLGDPFNQRNAAARTFDHVFTLDAPRDPNTWAAITERPAPAWTMDPEVVGKGLSTLGKGMGPALITKAKEMGVVLPAELNQPGAAFTPSLVVPFIRDSPRTSSRSSQATQQRRSPHRLDLSLSQRSRLEALVPSDRCSGLEVLAKLAGGTAGRRRLVGERVRDRAGVRHGELDGEGEGPGGEGCGGRQYGHREPPRDRGAGGYRRPYGSHVNGVSRAGGSSVTSG